MRTDRLLVLAAHIESLPTLDRTRSDAPTVTAAMTHDEFDMTVWLATDAECHTIGCIAGWACRLWPDDCLFDPHQAHLEPYDGVVKTNATAILDLSEKEAEALFTPGAAGLHAFKTDQTAGAAAALRRLARDPELVARAPDDPRAAAEAVRQAA